MDILMQYKIIVIILIFLLFLVSIVVMLMAIFTPAMTFLRAKFKKGPIIFTKYKDTFAEFQAGTKEKAGISKIRNQPIHLKKGSAVIETKSKMPLYFRLSSHGITAELELSAIMDDLQKKGIIINTWHELKHYMLCVENEKYKEEYIASIEDETQKQTENKKIETLKTTELKLENDQTYPFSHIKNLLPYNINAGFMEAYSEEEVNLAIKSKKNKEMLFKVMIVGAFAILLILLGAGIFFQLYDPPDKKVICDCVGKGLQTAINMTI